MDRAHRLGQQRTVNVYRLLTRGTIEEKVMGLQQFKLDVANAVVNQDNVSLKNMDTGKLLDLFGATGQEASQPQEAKQGVYSMQLSCTAVSQPFVATKQVRKQLICSSRVYLFVALSQLASCARDAVCTRDSMALISASLVVRWSPSLHPTMACTSLLA